MILIVCRRVCADYEDDQGGLVKAEDEGREKCYDQKSSSYTYNYDMRIHHDSVLALVRSDSAGVWRLDKIRDKCN